MPQLNTRSALPGDIRRLYELYAEQRDIQDELDPRLEVTRFQDDYTAEIWIAAKRILFRDGTLDENHLLMVVEDDRSYFGIYRWVVGRRGRYAGAGACRTWSWTRTLDRGVREPNYSSAAMDWFRGHDVRHVIVDAVPRNHAVQQAFWRAKGLLCYKRRFICH